MSNVHPWRSPPTTAESFKTEHIGVRKLADYYKNLPFKITPLTVDENFFTDFSLVFIAYPIYYIPSQPDFSHTAKKKIIKKLL